MNLWKKLKRWWFLEDYYPYESCTRYDPVSGEPRHNAKEGAHLSPEWTGAPRESEAP